MKLLTDGTVRSLTGWHKQALDTLLAQGIDLELHDGSARDGRSPRRSAQELANEATKKGAHGILSPDPRVLRALCGNASYRGRLITLIDEQGLMEYRTRQSPAYSAAIFDACAIVIAPSTVAKELVDSKELLSGQIFIFDGDKKSSGMLLHAEMANLNQEERIKLALTQIRVAIDLADEGSTRLSVSFSPGIGPDSIAVFRLARRGVDESPSRSAWKLRRQHEWHGIRLVLSDDLDLAAYTGTHPELATLVVPVIRTTTPAAFLDEFERSARWVVVRTERDRHDLELLRPALAGRIAVLPQTDMGDALLARLAERIGPPAPRHSGQTQTRVILAGHDLKFTGALIEELTRRGDVSIASQVWENQYHLPNDLDGQAIESADVIWVEFASGPAAWYAKRKRPGQRLIVRVHGYEVRGPWGDDIKWEAVDILVCVSQSIREAAIARWHIPASKAVVISNAVDPLLLHRPKHPDAVFTLGLMGWTPALKRLDRAVALVDRLRIIDDRFQLVVKGSPVTRESWIWSDATQRRAYESVFQRLRSDPELAKHVIFEEFGGAIAQWLVRVGFILSPSDTESFHLACMEGMASGAVPLIWDREGANSIYPQRFIVRSVDEAQRLVLNASQQWNSLSKDAIEASTLFDVLRIRTALAQAIGLPPAP